MSLMCSLAAHHCVTVVGDDDQSIFSFSGADPTHFLQFFDHFSRHKLIFQKTELLYPLTPQRRKCKCMPLRWLSAYKEQLARQSIGT